MEINFAPTRSFCYRFGRYKVLSEIQQMPEVISGGEFRLTELAQRVIDKYLSPEQQQTKIKKEQSDRLESVHSIIKFVASFIAKQQETFARIGEGVYKSRTEADVSDIDLEDAALADGDTDVAEFGGWTYAFSFPMLVKSNEPFPIKIGTTIGSVEDRVLRQCRESASFDNPIILGKCQVKRVGPMELAAHNVLKASGKWRQDVPGTEWFNTTTTEVKTILDCKRSTNPRLAVST